MVRNLIDFLKVRKLIDFQTWGYSSAPPPTPNLGTERKKLVNYIQYIYY
jgi:hypothetical protein